MLILTSYSDSNLLHIKKSYCAIHYSLFEPQVYCPYNTVSWIMECQEEMLHMHSFRQKLDCLCNNTLICTFLATTFISIYIHIYRWALAYCFWQFFSFNTKRKQVTKIDVAYRKLNWDWCVRLRHKSVFCSQVCFVSLSLSLTPCHTQHSHFHSFIRSSSSQGSSFSSIILHSLTLLSLIHLS